MPSSPYNYILSLPRRLIARLFVMIGVILMAFGVFHGSSQVSRDQGGIFFLVDTSRSMSVGDILGPDTVIHTRLDGAKDLLTRMAPYTPHALMTFTDTAHLQIPFSRDEDFWKTSVDTVNISSRGASTDIAGAISAARLVLGDRPSTLVILTDGEITAATGSSIVEPPKNIQVIFVGIGTREGGRITDRYDGEGNIVYKTLQGKDVISRLDTGELQKLADLSHGDLVTLEKTEDIPVVEEYIRTHAVNNSDHASLDPWIMIGALCILGGLVFPDFRKK